MNPPAASDVVITGLGVVSPIGSSREAVWQSLADRQSGVRHLPELAAAGWIAPFGGDVRDLDPKQYVKPRKSLKVMCREMQFGAAAAEMALEDAGIAEGQFEPERTGVVQGAPGHLFCDLEELEPPYLAWLRQQPFDITCWPREAFDELFPLWMLKYLPNLAGCHVGIRLGALGPTNTISAGDVSSLEALAEAASVIRRGAADVMLAGGIGSYLNLTRLMWHRGARLSTSRDEPARVCRPFDAQRSGMVYGEGAAYLVLESRAHAARRGREVIARVAGAACRAEPAAVTRQPTGDAIARAIRAALQQADLAPGDVGHVNAHGNSTREDDPAEATAIRRVLGDVPVTAPKSYFGNLSMGSGLVELAVSLIALGHDVIPATLNYETPDEECPVQVVTEARETRNRTFLALNHAPSGQAAAVVIEG